MSTVLRVTLLVASLVTGIWIMAKIRKNRVKQENALFWICFSILLAVIGVFPQIITYVSGWFGVISPANFLFLVIIALLTEKIFSLSIQASKLESQVELLAAELAIRTRDSGTTPSPGSPES